MDPPKKAINGISFDSNTFHYKIAEKPKVGHNLLTRIYSDNYTKLHQFLLERKNFEGEYSVFLQLSK